MRERERDRQRERCRGKVKESGKFEIDGLLNRRASETSGQSLVTIFSFNIFWHTAECLQVKYERMIASYIQENYLQGSDAGRAPHHVAQASRSIGPGQGSYVAASDLPHRRHRTPPKRHCASNTERQAEFLSSGIWWSQFRLNWEAVWREVVAKPGKNMIDHCIMLHCSNLPYIGSTLL